MKAITYFNLGLLALALATFSCKKDNENEPDTFAADQRVAQDDNRAENEEEDVAGIEDEIMSKSSVNFGRVATDTTFPYENCATVTVVPRSNGNPGTVTVDFGNGCTGQDQRVRKGKIIWTFTDRLMKPGAVIVTTFQNYAVKNKNATQFVSIDNSSTKTTTNTSASEPLATGAIVTFSRSLNMKFINEDGSVFTRQGTRNLEWQLVELGNRWDNIYTLKAGSQITGVDRVGRNYTKTAITDVVRKAECALLGYFKPVSGQVKIENDNKTKIVDFGNGTCDGEITVTINGRVRKTRW
jgi:hypothetical protein